MDLRNVIAASALGICSVASAQGGNRPPAVPLVAHDPYFSVWSNVDRLTDGDTVHWTGRKQALRSHVVIDGKPYRLMGATPGDMHAAEQIGLWVHPTQTAYRFETPEADVYLTFLTPTLPDDIEVLSRPITYVTWTLKSRDGKTHRASVHFDASSDLAVNDSGEAIRGETLHIDGLTAARVGRVDQAVLNRSGDDLRIEWGHLYLASDEKGAKAAYGPLSGASGNGLAIEIPVGEIATESIARTALIAYDDEYSIQYMGRNLRPFWRRNGMDAAQLLQTAAREQEALTLRCANFDKELTTDMTAAGGADYAYIGSLAYRQSFAAQKVVADAHGQPLMFSKENFSNGCIGTVDVLYPAAPVLILLSPTLLKASLQPLMDYASSDRWRFPFAPHDLGQYPLANGQVYGGGELTEDNQMPVEETGNMLLLLAALAKHEGSSAYADRYWPILQRWAAYLLDKGFDPESQLSTDDFAGHLAHNVNLSAKAIEALGAYAYLCQLHGDTAESARVRTIAEGFAKRWEAESRNGDHYRLAFDKPDTWSQKYNLVWDRILGFNLFDPTIATREIAFYRTQENAYGLPLDSRRDYTKLDWIIWTATLTGQREDFDALVGPIVKFLNATPNRVPMSDWFHTIEPKQAGFQARSVVGGVFIKLLDTPDVWAKYAGRDKFALGEYAPIPKRPVVTEVVPTSRDTAQSWHYTFTAPVADWFSASFADETWNSGPGGFGTEGTPGAVVRTKWDSSDIWIRRAFDLDSIPPGLNLYIHHDEDAEVYVNGRLIAKLSGYTSAYQTVALSEEALKALRPGHNVIAIHCHQTGGGQYLDAGFALETIPK